MKPPLSRLRRLPPLSTRCALREGERQLSGLAKPAPRLPGVGRAGFMGGSDF